MTAVKNFRVDSFVAGLAIKAPCHAFTTAPITLSGEQTVNGIVLNVGDRCLVKDQADPVENGIYNVEKSAWQRAGDWDGSRDVVGGTIVPAWDPAHSHMNQYAANGNADRLTPGTDSITFFLFLEVAAASIVDDLQSVCDQDPTSTTDIQMITGASIIWQTADDLDTITLSMNDSEQAYPFPEFVSTAAVEAYRFDKDLWVLGELFLSGNNAEIAFYGRGDAVSHSFGEVSGNMRVTAVGANFEIQANGADFRGTPIIDYSVKHQTLTSSSGAVTWDYEAGQSAYIALTENITSITFSNLDLGSNLQELELEILQDTTARTITWPASVKWAGGTAPDLSTVSSTHIVHLRTRDSGTTWLGTHAAEFS